MGHTLVTRFDPESRAFLQNLMAPFAANKIPFGRNCDREAADEKGALPVSVFPPVKTEINKPERKLRI